MHRTRLYQREGVGEQKNHKTLQDASCLSPKEKRLQNDGCIEEERANQREKAKEGAALKQELSKPAKN